MISILLVSHGPLAAAMIKSSEMLVGRHERLRALSLEQNDDFRVFQESLLAAATELDDGDGVLMLADLLGGSPYNAAAMCMGNGRFQCLTGLNLSMLLTALDQRELCALPELVGECAAAAASNIVDVRRQLEAAGARGDDDDE